MFKTVLIIESHNMLTYVKSVFKPTAAIILVSKLASEFIASAISWREFNVSIGNPTTLLIASNVDKN